MAEFDGKTCTRIEVQEEREGGDFVKKVLFVKSEWKPTRSDPTSFDLAISDGLRAWRFGFTEEKVRERAELWDKNESWVMEKLKFYLALGQPGVTYRFTKTRDGRGRKLSFDIEDKESDLLLNVNIPVENASEPKTVTCDLLGFLYDGNCRLTESYLKKCRSFNWLTRENELLTDQNKRFKNEKVKFEEDIYKKFVAVLNTKKSKLKELKKEVNKWMEQSKSKSKSVVKEEDERDDTTSSSSEGEDEDEEESGHEKAPEEKLKFLVKQRDKASRKELSRRVSEENAPSESAATSGGNVVNADLDATQPFIDEIENAAPVIEPPKEDLPSLPPLVGDAPYVGLQRKRRRN